MTIRHLFTRQHVSWSSRAWSPILLIWIGLNLLACACLVGQAPTHPQTPRVGDCRSLIFLFVDVSGSLHADQKEDFAKTIAGLFKPTASTPFTQDSDVYLIPFADRIGAEAPLDVPNALPSIQSFLGKTSYTDDDGKALDKNQSNLLAILRKINELIQSDGRLKGPHVVIMIASDFIHDDTPEDTDASRSLDYEHWQTEKIDLLKSLSKEFYRPDPPVLLLLQANTQDRLGRLVLDDIRRLAPYDSQIYPIEPEPVNLTSLAEHLNPFSTAIRVDNNSLRIDIFNHCFKVPRAKVEVQVNAQRFGDIQSCEFSIAKTDCTKVFTDNRSPQEWPPRGKLEVTLTPITERINGHSPLPIPLGELNLAEYVFLSRLTLYFDSWSPNLVGDAQISSVLWHTGGPARMSLSLRENGASHEKPCYINIERPQGGDPTPHHCFKEISIDPGKMDLARLCYSKKRSLTNALKLQVTVEDGLWVQKTPLSVNIIPDEGRDFLEDIVHNGSIPVFLTLFTIFCMSVFRRDLDLAKVHEILGVAGFWTITFFLVRRVPYINRWIDMSFFGLGEQLVTIAIGIMLTLVGWVMVRHGALAQPKSREEIAFEIATADMRARGVGERDKPLWKRLIKKIRNSWLGQAPPRYFRFAIVVVIPIVAIAIMLRSKPRSECTFEVVDDFLASNEVKQHLAPAPMSQGGH